MAATAATYATLALRRIAAVEGGDVLVVMLNRPKHANAMNSTFWNECRECFRAINQDTSVRAVVIAGEGKHFSAGLDLTDTALVNELGADGDVGRRAFHMRATVTRMQESFTAIEDCHQPVIAAIQGACVGGGIDLVAACDVRYATQDAFFSIKEVDVGLAADVGSLQRLPKIVGNHSLLRELAYTARRFDATEALQLGLISKILPDGKQALETAIATAKEIASKSPVAVIGTKRGLLYARDHSVTEGLEQIATWNMAMLQSNDVTEAAVASLRKAKPTFAKL